MKFYTGDEIIYKDPETGERYNGTFLAHFGIPGLTSRIQLDGKYNIIVPTGYLLPRSAEVFMDPTKMARQAPDVDVFMKAAEEFEAKREADTAAQTFTSSISGPPQQQAIPKAIDIARVLAGKDLGGHATEEDVEEILKDINQNGLLDNLMDQISKGQDVDF